MKTSGVIAIFVSMLLILAACGSVSPSLENNEYALPENNEYPLPEDDEYPLLEAYNPLIFEGLWFMVTAGVERTSYEFHQNGEGMMSRIVTLGMHDTPLTWSVSGERLEIFFDDQPTPRIYYFEFLDDDTFTLRREGWSPYSIVTFERVEVIEDNNPLVFEGRWLLAATAGTEGMVYKFHQNGEGTTSRNVVAGAHETPITWSVSGDRLEIFFDDQPTPTEYYFEFLDDDAFTLRRPGWSPYSFMTFERVEIIEDSNPFVFEGRWLLAATAGTEGMVYKFHQNGEGTTSRNVVAGAHETPITWSVSGDKLEIFFDDQPTPTEYYFEFLDDDAFTLRRPGWSPYSFMTFERAELEEELQ